MIFDLPAPDTQGARSLANCIMNRRSVREYAESPIPVSYLSQLLWSAQGHTGSTQKRSTPSAGGLYPLHLYILVRRVVDLPPGIYEYKDDDHSLRLLDSQVPELKVKELGIGDQPWLSESAVVIGVAANFEDSIKHFASQHPHGERGRRYAYMESGALAQNVHLQATDIGIGCVLVAGFKDSLAKAILRLSSDLEPTALLCIGPRREN
ncbi:MAG: SagB-type dehydrogenase family enzyme [Oleiphilaceae bacterium]|jgi:SagB-type dehydrogenase family enzyme